MLSWRRCKLPSGSWRRTCRPPDAAATSTRLNSETPDKPVRTSRGKLWNTSREFRRYVGTRDTNVLVKLVVDVQREGFRK